MYDCIIIGTGPAGLSAALNLKTYKKSFVWFGSKNLSDKVQKAEKITNYPGFPELTGQELFSHFYRSHTERRSGYYRKDSDKCYVSWNVLHGTGRQ